MDVYTKVIYLTRSCPTLWKTTPVLYYADQINIQLQMEVNSTEKYNSDVGCTSGFTIIFITQINFFLYKNADRTKYISQPWDVI